MCVYVCVLHVWVDFVHVCMCRCMQEVSCTVKPNFSIHLAVEHVPMQGNPAYETLETIIPSAQAPGQVLQPSKYTGTELCKQLLLASCIPIKQKHKIQISIQCYSLFPHPADSKFILAILLTLLQLFVFILHVCLAVENVCMQGNPSYEALETAIPSTRT